MDLLLEGSNYNGWNLPFALEQTIHDNVTSQKAKALSDRSLTLLADPNAYFTVIIADTDSFVGSAQIDYTFYGEPKKRILTGDWFDLQMELAGYQNIEVDLDQQLNLTAAADFRVAFNTTLRVFIAKRDFDDMQGVQGVVGLANIKHENL